MFLVCFFLFVCVCEFGWLVLLALFCLVLTLSYKVALREYKNFSKRKFRGTWWRCVILYPSVGNICIRAVKSCLFHQRSDWLYELTNKTLDYHYSHLLFHFCLPTSVLKQLCCIYSEEDKWVVNGINTDHSQSDSITIRHNFLWITLRPGRQNIKWNLSFKMEAHLKNWR